MPTFDEKVHPKANLIVFYEDSNQSYAQSEPTQAIKAARSTETNCSECISIYYHFKKVCFHFKESPRLLYK